ncbi:MAG: DUF2889 domain-containing protein [Gammaproteobacteria bacterium]|nr:DUF2889 domain-containing protein [Gammaproteobacteria bacterium]
MPLKPASKRTHLHSRKVACEGYQRDDGLWDIEARLVDTKPFRFENRLGGRTVGADEPIHGMQLRVTLDLGLTIRDIDAASDFHPFGACSAAPERMQALIGLKIGGGFMRQVRERVGVSLGCTHLIEMMSHIATTAFQTMNPTWEEIATKKPNKEKPHYLDSCVALRGDGDVIRRAWPDFYRQKS